MYTCKYLYSYNLYVNTCKYFQNTYFVCVFIYTVGQISILSVCLGSLSCWKTQPRPIFNALTEGRRLLAKISRYMAPSILPSIRCSRPVPFAEKHPQSMMFPPPCFTVGMVFLGLYSSFFLQTRRVEFIPKCSILVSSDHMTFSHASSGSSRWSLANFRRAWTCAGLSRGTLSCCLLTKLFAYCPVAHPSLVQVCNCVPSVLRQLFGLAHSGEVGVWLIECVNKCLLYR